MWRWKSIIEKIRFLSIRGRELRLFHYGKVDSTQRVARELVKRGVAVGTIVIADSQTAGHGRYGREWVSPPGGLYTSIILAKDSLLSLRAGVAVAEMLIDYGLNARLKWPNDVVIGEKKICGILVEDVSGSMALGIGVNLREVPHPESTSVLAACGHAPYPEEALAQIVTKLFAPVPDDVLVEEYRSLCATIGKEVSISNGTRKILGQAAGIDQRGRLLLDTITGRKVISSGECIHLFDGGAGAR